VLEIPDELAIDVFNPVAPLLIVKFVAELLLDETDDEPADWGVPVVRPVWVEEAACRACIGISIELSVGWILSSVSNDPKVVYVNTERKRIAFEI
jgi:hypothetical protein